MNKTKKKQTSEWKIWLSSIFCYSPSETKNKLKETRAGKQVATNNQKDKKSVIESLKKNVWKLVGISIYYVLASVIIAGSVSFMFLKPTMHEKYTISIILNNPPVLESVPIDDFANILSAFGAGLGTLCAVYIGFLVPTALKLQKIRSVEWFFSYARAREISVICTLVIGTLACLPVFLIFDLASISTVQKVLYETPFIFVCLFISISSSYLFIWMTPDGLEEFSKKYRQEYIEYKLDKFEKKNFSENKLVKIFSVLPGFLFALGVFIWLFFENLTTLDRIFILCFLVNFIFVYAVVFAGDSMLSLLSCICVGITGLLVVILIWTKLGNINNCALLLFILVSWLLVIGTTIRNCWQISRVYKQHDFEVELEWLQQKKAETDGEQRPAVRYILHLSGLENITVNRSAN